MIRSAEKTILIVDDSEDDVILLSRAFQKAGVTNPVRVVNSGEDAMHYLSGRDHYSDRAKFPLPSVVLLDKKLPKIDGFGVLSWIKSDPSLKRIVVIMLTSMALNGDVNRAYELGANSVVVKPGTLDGLMVFASTFHEYWNVLDKISLLITRDGLAA